MTAAHISSEQRHHRGAGARRNVTLALPIDLLKRARVVAAQQDTSLTSLVEEYLTGLVQREEDYDRVWAEEFRQLEQDSGMRIGEITWTRDDLHDRSL
ncbi:MAG: hypothetical protein BGO26_20400 [Actinobacteria bacterium 69-20]|jgi:hypothetical protein|nr:hypothetical protein [Actinomycetota bacterium]OJV24858.1 MAG: hypothetical protein BGO26_20400 [Actinobacteria bacterium 69-20]